MGMYNSQKITMSQRCYKKGNRVVSRRIGGIPASKIEKKFGSLLKTNYFMKPKMYRDIEAFAMGRDARFVREKSFNINNNFYSDDNFIDLYGIWEDKRENQL